MSIFWFSSRTSTEAVYPSSPSSYFNLYCLSLRTYCFLASSSALCCFFLSFFYIRFCLSYSVVNFFYYFLGIMRSLLNIIIKRLDPKKSLLSSLKLICSLPWDQWLLLFWFINFPSGHFLDIRNSFNIKSLYRMRKSPNTASSRKRQI